MLNSAGAYRRLARGALWLTAVLVVLAIGLVAAIYSAPARRYVLRRAIATLEERYQLRLQAESLDYDLFALSVTLRDVRLASTAPSAPPFFRARRLLVQVPSSMLFGPFAIETMAIEEGRVRIVREEDGRTNLPAAEGAGGEPAALPLGSLIAQQLAIDLDDRKSQSGLRLPAIDLAISPSSGRVVLLEAGRLYRGDVGTTVQTLRGGMSFDGRRLQLSNVTVQTDELAAAIDGDVDLLVDAPGVDLRISGRADAARLARWGAIPDPPRADVEFKATARGPIAAPEVDASVRTNRIDWRDATIEDLAAVGRATIDTLDIQKADARLAGGSITASGSMPLGEGETRLIASWKEIELEGLSRMLAARASPRPSGTLSGVVEAHGPAADLKAWLAEARIEMHPGQTSRDRVALDGRIALRVDRGAWSVGDEGVTAGGLPLRASLGGRINLEAFDRTTVKGVIELLPTTIAQLTDTVRRVGLSTADVPDLAGTIHAKALVDGEVRRPRTNVDGAIEVADLAPLAPGTALGGPAVASFSSDLRSAHIKGSVPDLNTDIDGTVALEAPYRATVDITTSNADVERLARGVEVPVPLTGQVSASLHATGEARDWQRGRAEIEIQRLEARAGSLPVRLMSAARGSVADQGVNIVTLDIAAGDTHVSAAGRLALRNGAAPIPDADALRVTATGDLAAFLNAAAATGAVQLPDVAGSGPAALLARVTGSAEEPRISADLELGPGTVQAQELPPATNVRLRLHSDGSWVELRDLGAEWQGARITATGRAPVAFDGRTATLTAQIVSITPQVLTPFVEAETLSQIGGSVDATLQLRSTALDPAGLSGELRLDRMDLLIADLPVTQQEPTRVVIRDGFARVESWRWIGQGGSIGVLGQVRLSDRQAALLTEGRFDLRMLTPFTRSAGAAVLGALEPKLSITGPLANPRIDGVASIVDAEIRLTDPRVIATNLDGHIVLTGARAQLTALSGGINGGTLSASGSASYGPGDPTDGKLALGIRGMALEYPQGLRSEVDADLELAVTVPEQPAQPAGELSGTVTVVRSNYRQPLAVATGLLTTLRARSLAAQVAPEPSLVDNLALDVRVLTNEDIIVDNNVGRLQLGADLRVIGTVAAPALSGRAQLREGGQLFLGRNRYEIESGTIDFANPVAIEPDLNIVANTRAGGQDISIGIKGTPDQQEVTLRSSTNPELGQADIASLLITGRTLDQISGNEAEIVGEQALAYLSGDILGFAGRAVGLDTIRLGGVDDASGGGDASAITTEIDPTARLTFGKSIGRDLDVTFSQSLRDADAQTWIVDYRPRRQVEARFISNDENLRSYAFRHDVSFGGVSVTDAPVATRKQRAVERVGAVSITGATKVSEASLKSALTLQPGDRFDFTEWQRDRDRLEALLHRERFYEARVTSRRAEDGGVALTYAVMEGPRTTIDVLGYALSDDTLLRLRAAWADAVFDQFLADEARAIVHARLWKDGYFQANVVASIATTGEEKTLRVQIDPGSKTASQRLRFDGVDGPASQALDAWAASRPALAQAMDDPAVFSRALTAWLRARGHLRASVKIGAPIVEGGEAIVPVAIDAGPVFSVTSVRFEGATAFDQATLDEIVALAPGEPFDALIVDERRDRLRARYRREGFRTARVDTQSALDEQARGAAVIFVIVEGPRQVLRAVDIEGNRAIDTDVITRALNLPSGEPVGADAWLQARRRLFDTGLFRRVDVTAEPVTAVPTNANEESVRARVAVQEWPALRLRYGFQVAEERPEGEVEGRDLVPGLSADITRRTLFGRAVTLGAAVDYQRRERRGRAFLTAPTMLGWPIESSVVLERSREDFSSVTLVTDLTTASWEQRFRFRRDLRLSYAYRFERNHTFDTMPQDPDFAFDLTVNVATLNTAAAWDRRDDAADTTKGWLLSSSLDWAPASLGSEFRFTRYLAQAYYFRPWRSVVLASAARVGLAMPLGGQDLIPSERFFAGGSRTVRGVAEDGLGPRDALGDPAGGESLLVLNQEVRFPIYRWLRGVGFLDGGNIFADTAGIDPGDLVGSYGTGLRLATPFALFRVDYGRLFSPRTGERTGRWYFGIGQAF